MENVLNKLVLDLPKPNSYLVKEVNKLGKEDIKNLLKPLRQLIRTIEVEIRTSATQILKFDFDRFKDPQMYNVMKKENLVNLYTSLISSIDNIVAFTQVSSKIKETWLLILHSDSVSSSEIKKVLGRDIVVYRTYWGYTNNIEPAFAKAIATSDYSWGSNKEYTFTVDPSVRRSLIEKIEGNTKIAFELVPSLPKEKELEIIDFEENIADELQYLQGLAMSGQLLTDTGKLTDARIKKIRKAGFIEDFKDSDSLDVPDRIELLAYPFEALYQKQKRKKKKDGSWVKNWAKWIVEEYPRNIDARCLSSFYPEFSGINKSWGNEPNTEDFATMLTPILKGASQDWLNLDNLWLNYLCFPVSGWSGHRVAHLFSSHSMNKHSLRLRGNGEYDRYYLDWTTEFDFPFLLRWLKFLCAAGLIELACDPRASSEDKYEGIRYLRLTAMGRYAFDFTEDYEEKRKVIPFVYEYDSLNNILTVLSDNSPYSAFLSKISRKIGGNRYSFSAEVFVKNGGSKDEVKSNMESLKRIIDTERYPALKLLLKEISERIDCSDKIPTEYILYRLRKDVPGLADFIMSNREIRAKVVLAEKSMLLIEKDFLDKLKKICLGAGYIL